MHTLSVETTWAGSHNKVVNNIFTNQCETLITLHEAILLNLFVPGCFSCFGTVLICFSRYRRFFYCEAPEMFWQLSTSRRAKRWWWDFGFRLNLSFKVLDFADYMYYITRYIHVSLHIHWWWHPVKTRQDHQLCRCTVCCHVHWVHQCAALSLCLLCVCVCVCVCIHMV